jgi:hypothetical protein
MVGTMGTMNTDIDLQNDPDIPEARQMIIDLVGAHMGPTPKELPQFTNVAFDQILSGDDSRICQMSSSERHITGIMYGRSTRT